MSHQMKQTNRIELPSHEDNFVRHLRSRHPYTAFPIPRSADLGFLKLRPLRGRRVIIYIIPQKVANN